jgi:hypothetical protein
VAGDQGILAVFIHFTDQRLYAYRPDVPGAQPQSLTPVSRVGGGLRWAEPDIGLIRSEVHCVLEEFAGDGPGDVHRPGRLCPAFQWASAASEPGPTPTQPRSGRRGPAQRSHTPAPCAGRRGQRVSARCLTPLRVGAGHGLQWDSWHRTGGSSTETAPQRWAASTQTTEFRCEPDSELRERTGHRDPGRTEHGMAPLQTMERQHQPAHHVMPNFRRGPCPPPAHSYKHRHNPARGHCRRARVGRGRSAGRRRRTVRGQP